MAIVQELWAYAADEFWPWKLLLQQFSYHGFCKEQIWAIPRSKDPLGSSLQQADWIASSCGMRSIEFAFSLTFGSIVWDSFRLHGHRAEPTSYACDDSSLGHPEADKWRALFTPSYVWNVGFRVPYVLAVGTFPMFSRIGEYQVYINEHWKRK